MLQWIKRRRAERRYRDTALARLDDLAPTSEPGAKALLAAYPAIRPVIDGLFAEGATPESAAVRVFMHSLADVFEKTITPERRTAILSDLEKRRSGAPTSPIAGEKDPATQWLLDGCGQAGRWLDDGKISRTDYDYLLDELMGAIRGESASMRSKRRIFDALHRGIVGDA